MIRCLTCKLPIYHGTWFDRTAGLSSPEPLFAREEKWRHADGLAPCNEPHTHAEPGGTAPK